MSATAASRGRNTLSVDDLQSVVLTMKAVAAAKRWSVRVSSACRPAGCKQTVEFGLGIYSRQTSSEELSNAHLDSADKGWLLNARGAGSSSTLLTVIVQPVLHDGRQTHSDQKLRKVSS